MNKYRLGEFEEIVMLTVAILYGNACGIAIVGEIEKRLNRKVNIGSLQTVLIRRDKKSYLESEFGEANRHKGGKQKRYFKITSLGRSVLEETKNPSFMKCDIIRHP